MKSRGVLHGGWQFLHKVERNTLYEVPGYLEWWKRHRTGACKTCGLCCAKCVYLMPGGKCSVYKDRFHYKGEACNQDYPQSWLQQKSNLGKLSGGCGYKWTYLK